MNKRSSVSIRGLKCDNPKCKYSDDNIEFKDYRRYINKPCPECGLSLLTTKEYLMCKFIIGTVSLYNKIFKNQVDMKSVKIEIVDKDRFE